LFTLHKERGGESAHREAARRWLIFAVFCGVFSAIYEYFSHSVYSGYMIGLFLFPLLLGALPALILNGRGRPAVPPACRSLWSSGVATLTAGSCMTGILEIYGTGSGYLIVYWIAGLALLAAGAALYFLRRPAQAG